MKYNELSRRDFLRISALCGAGVTLAACTANLPNFSNLQTDSLRSLTIFYTNDEHGWMEPTSENGGAAGMLHQWQHLDGYSRDGSFLVLSGGDMWTGPALSTWFKGESMVAVMNAMGYAAAAIGNHDFDFGVEELRKRANQANFPLLSANIREKETGQVPDFCQPYVIQKINGIQVGMIGLTTLATPHDTNPSNVAEYDFLPYEESLKDVAPEVKAAGAQLLLLLGHLCSEEMRSLATVSSNLGIPFLFSGHCHEELVEQDGNVIIVQSGSFFKKYIRIALLFDTVNNRLVDMDARLLDNPRRGRDQDISALVTSWHDRADPSLWQVIGYTRQKIDSASPEMAKLITTPWLEAYPSARIAFFNPRYVQSLPAGDISEASILGTLPTDNELVDIQLTGAQILEAINLYHPAVGGLREVDGSYLFADGSRMEPLESYHVLIPDNLYEGGNYFNVRQYDPDGSYTGIGWRALIVSWLKRLNTSRQTPLDTYLSTLS